MNETERDVATNEQLMAALGDHAVRRIHLKARLTGLPSIRLQPGQDLVGVDPGDSALEFAPGQDGLQLSADNHVHGITLRTDPERRALFNDTTQASLGTLRLHRLAVTGVVRLLATDRVRAGHVEAHDLHLIDADARSFDERPKGYGVEVIPGAFTLWNQQPDTSVAITADLTGLAAGRPGAPVRGSGIFVAGAGDTGGRLMVRRLETADVHSDGGIAPGTPDRISGGVFTVSGAFVDTVRNRGSVTTYGPNDMVLDNWGSVDRWIADEKITSYGPSGIGFVNFGTIRVLQVNGVLETFGKGARGFNVYTGTVRSAEFERVVTHADGAVGIQISQPVGSIVVRGGIETFGGIGDSLVKGVVVQLAAIPFSVKPGGAIEQLTVDGGLIAHGQGVDALELHGAIAALSVKGGLHAAVAS